MPRPACVINIADLPLEKRPRFTSTPGVAALLQTPSASTSLTHMGVNVRTIAPGLAGTNRHFHSAEEEWSYVLSGHGVVRLGPHTLPVRAGHFIGFPPGHRPHHFLCEGAEPLVLLEGGERRPSEDRVWYPDSRLMWRGLKPAEPYEEPPPEEGDTRQILHVDGVEPTAFQHSVDPAVRRQVRTLHLPTGLTRQAVYWARIERGNRSTVFHTHDRTDEWVFVLSGRAVARVGDDRFDVGPNDFLGHPAGGAAHVMEAVDELTYLMGGEVDADDVITYPEARLQRVGDQLRPLA